VSRCWWQKSPSVLKELWLMSQQNLIVIACFLSSLLSISCSTPQIMPSNYALNYHPEKMGWTVARG
jgi:hypothetical protein